GLRTKLEHQGRVPVPWHPQDLGRLRRRSCNCNRFDLLWQSERRRHPHRQDRHQLQVLVISIVDGSIKKRPAVSAGLFACAAVAGKLSVSRETAHLGREGGDRFRFRTTSAGPPSWRRRRLACSAQLPQRPSKRVWTTASHVTRRKFGS